MENVDKLKTILTEYKNKSNSDLKFAMDTLSKDFEETKEMLIKLTHHLDALEHNYNKILDEYKSRNIKE